MSMNPYDPAHRQIWDLIPWLVNGTLDDEQREIAHRHLDRCIDCRDEFDFQLRIQGGMAVDAHAPVGDCSASLARLMARIDEEDEGYGYEHVSLNLISVAETQRTARRVHRQRRLMRMLAAMVVVEALGLAALGTLWFGRGSSPAQPAAYTTLSTAAPEAAVGIIRLVPSPSLGMGELQALLAETGLHIAGSNATATVLTLAANGEADTQSANGKTSIEDTVQRLRANPGVLLAEPIPGAATSP